MDVTIEDKDTANNYPYGIYTVYVGDHRILTVSTDCSVTAADWLEGVYRKSHCSNTNRGTLVVGLSAERYEDRIHDRARHRSLKRADCQYDLIKLCVGSQCLIYELPDSDNRYGSYYDRRDKMPKVLIDLLACRKVVTAGIKMASVAKDLERLNGITVSNPVDLSVMAAKVIPETDKVDLSRCYDLDIMAKAVLGGKMEVVRPKPRTVFAPYGPPGGYETYFDVRIATLDSYLCFSIAYKLLDLANGNIPPEASLFTEKKPTKKEKKKSKSKS